MSDTIGARLRQARELRHLTLLQASESTKLRAHYLQALESDDFSAIPSAAQARGFLRIYAEFLGLDLSGLMSEFQPAPAAASAEAKLAPQPARTGGASLLAALGERLRLHPRADKEPAAEPVRLTPRPTEEPAAVPASVDMPTTRPTKAASQDVKKNSVVPPAEESVLAAVAEDPAASAPTGHGEPNASPLPSAEASAEASASDSALGVNTPRSSAVGSWLSRLRLRSPKPTTAAAESVVQGADGAEPAVEGSSRPGVHDFDPLVSDDAASAESSDAIFLDIGHQLRTRREMLSLTYEEIERHTHVRAPFLAALEQGCMEDLPSPVQTRGILINYARFLDLDVDAILLRFADGIQAQYREKGPRTPVRSRAPMPVKKTLPPLRGFVASDLIFGGGLAITLLLFAVWGINRVMVMRSQQPAQATQPSISELLASTPLPTLPQQVTVIPAQDTPAVTEIPSDATATLELATLNPNVKVQVVLTATQSTYMRITVDGKVKFEGRAEMGSSYSYDASNQVEVLTGNAAALKVTYNGQDLGLMGNFGEVADRLYTAEGIATPTPTAQPTRTPTPRVTATPTQTLTHTPSPTAAP